MFAVISGLPMPHGRHKYPFDQLAIGDMFFVPRSKNNLAAHVANRGTKLGMKFSTRLLYMAGTVEVDATTEGAVLGVGVWRVG